MTFCKIEMSVANPDKAMKTHAIAVTKAERGSEGGVCIRLTRHKISDRWRERASLQVECGSHRKRKRRAASGSLHRLVRRHGAIWTSSALGMPSGPREKRSNDPGSDNPGKR